MIFLTYSAYGSTENIRNANEEDCPSENRRAIMKGPPRNKARRLFSFFLGCDSV